MLIGIPAALFADYISDTKRLSKMRDWGEVESVGNIKGVLNTKFVDGQIYYHLIVKPKKGQFKPGNTKFWINLYDKDKFLINKIQPDEFSRLMDGETCWLGRKLKRLFRHGGLRKNWNVAANHK